MSTTEAIFEPFEHVVHMTSTTNSPMSAYYACAIALLNDVEVIFEKPVFDEVLGAGASASSLTLVKPRFNFSGRPPPGRKVGLLDPHHLWAFTLDPFSRYLNVDFDVLIPGGLSTIMNEATTWAFPGDDPVDVDMRQQLKSEWMAFETATGFFAHKFDDGLKAFPDGHKLTLGDVSSWIQKTGGHDSRLAWWTCHAKKTALFNELARPLLSIRITGSMTVERIAKPLKNAVMTKERAKMGTKKCEMCLRVGLNLRLLQAAKKELRLE